jgi:hypothetical protein
MSFSLSDILWLLSGDTTVMYELLADNKQIVAMARDVSDGKAKYEDLLKLSYEHF